VGRNGSLLPRLAGAVVLTIAGIVVLAWSGAAADARDSAARTMAGALAQYQYPVDRPGWGCGDDNHTHTGPPGAQYGSTPPPGCSQYKGPDGDQYQTTRPGFGCGDDNHTHTGPPGAQYGRQPPPGCSQYRGGR
jgi:hypothetical protein